MFELIATLFSIVQFGAIPMITPTCKWDELGVMSARFMVQND